MTQHQNINSMDSHCIYLFWQSSINRCRPKSQALPDVWSSAEMLDGQCQSSSGEQMSTQTKVEPVFEQEEVAELQRQAFCLHVMSHKAEV